MSNNLIMKLHSTIDEMHNHQQDTAAWELVLSIVTDLDSRMTAIESRPPLNPSTHRHIITADLVIETVADHFGISADAIRNANENPELIQARHIAMYLCRDMTNLSLRSIGDSLGTRDLSAVMHGIEMVNSEIQQNDDLRQTVDKLRQQIEEHSLRSQL